MFCAGRGLLSLHTLGAARGWELMVTLARQQSSTADMMTLLLYYMMTSAGTCCRCDLGPGSGDITCSNQYSASRLLKTANSWDISPVCQYLEYLWNTKCVISIPYCILFIFLFILWYPKGCLPSHLNSMGADMMMI